jgi:hypothetical protein
MRALLACGVLVIAGLAGGAPAAMSADAAAQSSRTASARTAAARTPAAPPNRSIGTRPIASGNAAAPAGGPGNLHKPSVPKAPLAASRPGKAPGALGGPAKYDAKKGAMLGGTVMPHRP